MYLSYSCHFYFLFSSTAQPHFFSSWGITGSSQVRDLTVWCSLVPLGGESRRWRKTVTPMTCGTAWEPDGEPAAGRGEVNNPSPCFRVGLWLHLIFENRRETQNQFWKGSLMWLTVVSFYPPDNNCGIVEQFRDSVLHYKRATYILKLNESYKQK